MPRGPGKKENYNLDYSRFNAFDRLDAEEASRQPEQAEADAAAGMPDFRDMLRGMPVELQEAYHLSQIAKQSGDPKAQQKANELALKAVEKGGPDVRNAFKKNLAEQMPDLAGKLGGSDLGPLDADGVVQELTDEAVDKAVAREKAKNAEDVTELRIDSLREQMLEGQKATRAELESLKQKQEELEKIRDPEEFFKFMTEGGVTQEDLQRIFSGDEEHMQARFNETIEQTMKKDVKGDKDPAKDSMEALKKVDELHGALYGVEPQEPEVQEAPEPPKPKKKAAPVEPEVTIPMYRLQYSKDEKGKYTGVELKCTLPGVADMSGINLDVSEKHLRLSTISPAPRYAVNAGPFPVLIDPTLARAKYSKKREELSISVPAKAD